MSKSEIVNAKIASTTLGPEDHGIFMWWLHLEMDGTGVGFGGYGIDEYDKQLKIRIDKTGMGLETIKAIMETVGVESWEKLKGQHIRVDTEGWGGKALGIGNLIKDRWFYPEEFFAQYADH
jgi:hypothetical protein